MFKEGDSIRLKKSASLTYKQYFMYSKVYTVYKYKNSSTLVVYVDGNSGLHGRPSEANFEYASRIHIGGE